MIVYKYLKADSLTDAIQSRSIRLRTPNEYNDPFDCDYYVSKREMKKAFNLFINYYSFKSLYDLFIVKNEKPVRFVCYANILKRNAKTISETIKRDKRYTYHADFAMYYSLAKTIFGKSDSELKIEFKQIIKKTLEEIKQAILVGCVSLTNDSILMWSHYSVDHKGACLEFEIDEKELKKVKYLRKPRSFKLTKAMEYVLASQFLGEKPNYDDKTLSFIAEPVFQKAKCWKYEKEMRLVFSNKDRDKHIDEENDIILLKDLALKRVIVGCEAGKELVDQIREVNATVPISKMMKVEGKYKVVETNL